MSRQRVAHGSVIDTPTNAEMAELLAQTFAQQKPEEYRRYKGAVTLDGNGNGLTKSADILVPSQYDLALDRVTLGGNGALGAIIALYENQVNDVDLLEVVDISAAAGVGGAPAGSTPISAVATGAAGAIAATLAAAAGATTYITGFQVTASGATAASVVQVTVGPLAGGTTLQYSFVFPAGAGVPANPLIVAFPEPIPASGPNTAISVSVPSGGAGNTNVSASAQGFQLPTGSGPLGKYSDSFSNSLFVSANSCVLVNVTGGVPLAQVTYNLQGRLIEKAR